MPITELNENPMPDFPPRDFFKMETDTLNGKQINVYFRTEEDYLESRKVGEELIAMAIKLHPGKYEKYLDLPKNLD